MARRPGTNIIELPTSTVPIDSPPPSTYEQRLGQDYTKRQKVADFLRFSRRRFQTADSASKTVREQMRKDQRFASGNGFQWEAQDRQAREDEGRPCIEINRIPQFIRQVENQMRANRSSILVNPRGKGASTDTAQALQGLIRSVEVESEADVAYDTAATHQLTMGLGFVRLVSQWADEEAWHQVCRLRRVRNPLSVYWDPSTQEADFSDCRWMHVIGVMGKDEYQDRWGKWSAYQSLTDYMTGEYQIGDWMPEGRVVVAEYYYVDVEERELLRMDTGQSIWAEELEQFRQMYALANIGEPQPRVLKSRVVDKRVVRWCLHNAIDILEGNSDRTAGRELPGSRIPIFPVMGDERDLDGDVDYRGMVRDARDPQRMYNFWSSSIAEAVALAPKAPWVAAKGQIEQYLEDWQNANRKPIAALVYDPKAVGDVLVPAPARSVVEPAVQAMVQGLSEANQDLMSVMGLFEPSLGQRGNHSESGKAREALQQQGVIANSNFLDNMQRTKRAVGRSLLEWIPVIYDVPRLAHLLQPDGKKLAAVIYAGHENKPDDDEFPHATDMYDVSVGSYDVAISTGPSFQDQKQATEAWLLELFKVFPPLAQIGADILLENSDDPAAKQLAERAKKMLPPQFQDQSDPATQVPQMQAKLAQAQQMLDLAHKAITSMAGALQKEELAQDTKKEIAIIAAQAQRDVAVIRFGSAAEQQVFDQEYQRFSQTVDRLHDMTMADAQADEAARARSEQAAASVQQVGAQAGAQMATNAHERTLPAPQQPPEPASA